MSAHLLILDFFLDQVDVSADYVLVRDFRGAMSCLSQTLSITFLLSCSLHFTGFSLLSRKAAMVTVLLFSTAPRYLHRILSAKRSTGQGIYVRIVFPFLFSCSHHHDWVSVFTICDL